MYAGNTQPSDHDTHKTQLSSHEQRPEGPLRDDAGFEITQEEAAVRTSLVAALDLPGQVQLATTCTSSKLHVRLMSACCKMLMAFKKCF